MATPRTADATLADGLARWLAQHHGVDRVTVDELERPSVGYASVTVLFRARWDRPGPVTEHLVLRMAPSPAGLFADYDLVAQRASQMSAATAGVPIATPLVESDPAWLGAPFMVMPRVDGHIVGEVPAFDPWVAAFGTAGQADLHEQFVRVLGRIHDAPTEPAVAGGVPVRADAAELDHWDEYLQWSSDGAPVPALVDALCWCRAHAPGGRADARPVLCWGDVRFGNVVFGDDRRPRAVLDWDMATIGSREHDVAWYTALATTMSTLLGQRVEGFPDRDGTVAQYEQLTGCPLHDFDWYETFALVRSTAIMTRIGYLARAAGDEPTMPIDDNPLLDQLREKDRRRMTLSALGLTDLDPTDPAFFMRPDYFDVLAMLRADAPVHRVADGLVLVARYDDIREISRDPARFRSSGGALVNDPMRTGSASSGAPSILFLDPPEHARHRGLVNRTFTPRAVSAMETRVRELARGVFDRLPDTSEPVDVVDHLTAPFPLLVIAELLGIPDGDRGAFRRWSDAAIESTDRPAEETMASIMEMHAFLTAHLEAKQRDPGDDIVSLLGQVELDGRRLTPDEVFIWLLTLLVAGNETTRTLLTGAMVALAEHPDQRAALAADPAGIPAAVEECLRWVTPIQAFCRTVVTDTTVGDAAVRADDYLVMLYASGNRDEAAFGPAAGAFDVTRPTTPANLAFGFGEHLCLGAALARLEARVFFEELLARFPTYRPTGAPERVPSTLVAGIERLPVVLEG